MKGRRSGIFEAMAECCSHMMEMKKGKKADSGPEEQEGEEPAQGESCC